MNNFFTFSDNMRGLQFLGRFQSILNGRPIQPVLLQIRFKKVSSPEKFCPGSKPTLCLLRDSEASKQILLSQSDGSLLDTLSRLVLKENIQVPVMSMIYDRKMSPNMALESFFSNRKKCFENLPKEIKFGK